MTVDQEARNMAQRALSLIEKHESVCAERANEAKTWRTSANDKLDRIESGINNKIASMGKDIGNAGSAIRGVYNRMWACVCGLVVTLTAVIGYLIVHHGL